MFPERLVALAALLFVAALGAAAPEKAQDPATSGMPEIRREMRGVWVATVSNIDWPSTSGLTSEQQQQELVAILDKVAELRMNAVVLQVRTSCDALYDSKIEPWSEYLTGQMGKAPDPYWDPLKFAVDEAHKRGIELHCWFNPYRARVKGSAKGPASDNHISKTYPELVKDYGGFLWMDPGEKAVQDHSMNVIMDVVKRYDIDAVHMDDYFYPYKENKKDEKGKEIRVNGKAVPLDFPDEVSWEKYKKSGGKLTRSDWRRDNVNKFIERLYTELKKTKPSVKFGLSPFGIWKPGFPKQIEGLNQYEELYADAKLWWNKGWVDYWTPQLYWTIAKPPQSYPVLLKWWAEENTKDRHLWPGLFTSKTGQIDRGTSFSIDEIPYQIQWTRLQEGATGHIHFSMRMFTGNKFNFNEVMTTATGVYAQEALMPSTPWLDDDPPAKPKATASAAADGTHEVKWEPVGEEKPFLWAIYRKTANAKGVTAWTTDVAPASETSLTIPDASVSTSGAVVVISAVDRQGNESERAVVKIQKGGARTAEE